MARKTRVNLENAIYHVFARGNNRAPVFLDDGDRRAYLKRLGRVATELNWQCLAYCLMSNHFHLLLKTPEANLSFGMQRLLGPYTQWFNGRHHRVGHLFQGRFRSELVDTDAYLSAVTSYIAMNPVEAGLCSTPEEWPWSNFGAAPPQIDTSWLRTDTLFELIALGHPCESFLKGA